MANAATSGQTASVWGAQGSAALRQREGRSSAAAGQLQSRYQLLVVVVVLAVALYRLKEPPAKKLQRECIHPLAPDYSSPSDKLDAHDWIVTDACTS